MLLKCHCTLPSGYIRQQKLPSFLCSVRAQITVEMRWNDAAIQVHGSISYTTSRLWCRETRGKTVFVLLIKSSNLMQRLGRQINCKLMRLLFGQQLCTARISTQFWTLLSTSPSALIPCALKFINFSKFSFIYASELNAKDSSDN